MSLPFCTLGGLDAAKVEGADGAFKVGGFPSGGPEVVMGLCVESVAEVGKASNGVGTMEDFDAGNLSVGF